MNLREQEYVLAIAKHNSIKYAAEELFISSSSLSVFLKELEEREGIPFFNRIGKKFYPTVAGEIYIDTAQQMILLKQAYTNRLADLRNEVTGMIRFGLHIRRANYILPSLLPKFKEKYPNVKVIISELGTMEMIEHLNNGKVDLILTNRISEQDNLILQEIHQDQLLMVTPKDHPCASLAVNDDRSPYPWINLSLIADETFIVQEKEQATRKYTDEAFSYAKITPRNTHVIQNLETATKLASSGYGLAFNFETYLKSIADSIPFDLYSVGDPSFRTKILLAYNKNTYIPGHLKYFMQLIKENFQ